MSYSIDHIAAALKRARERHGLSQRELGARAGLPQAHISKIESGAVDLKASSLIELARVLGLEVMLVPLPMAPAVQALTGQQGSSPPSTPGQPDELKRLAGLLRRWKEIPTAEHHLLERARRTTADLAALTFDAAAVAAVSRILKQLKAARKTPAAADAIGTAVSELASLRDRLARAPATASSAPRHAYRLDEDDDDA